MFSTSYSPVSQGSRMVQPYLSSAQPRESISNYPAPSGVNPSLYKNLIACIRGYNLTTAYNSDPNADAIRGEDAKKVLQALLQVPNATLGSRGAGSAAASAGLDMARQTASYASGLASPYASRLSTAAAPYASRASSYFGTRGQGGRRKRKGKRTRRSRK